MIGASPRAFTSKTPAKRPFDLLREEIGQKPMAQPSGDIILRLRGESSNMSSRFGPIWIVSDLFQLQNGSETIISPGIADLLDRSNERALLNSLKRRPPSCGQ